MNDYIKIFRQITDWEWYTDPATKDVFLHLLITANRFPGRWRGMEIDTGQKITSVANLAAETGLSIKNVRTALKHLESTGEISVKATNKWTLVTIENYALYQGDGVASGKQVASKWQTGGKQGATNKKGRKEESKKGSESTTYSCQNIVQSYNNICKSMPKVEKLTDSRKAHLRARLRTHSEEEIRLAFVKAEQSDWLSGRSSDWHADFDWITKKEDNLVKILEGHYDNRDHVTEGLKRDLADIYAGGDEEKMRHAYEVLK